MHMYMYNTVLHVCIILCYSISLLVCDQDGGVFMASSKMYCFICKKINFLIVSADCVR